MTAETDATPNDLVTLEAAAHELAVDAESVDLTISRLGLPLQGSGIGRETLDQAHRLLHSERFDKQSS